MTTARNVVMYRLPLIQLLIEKKPLSIEMRFYRIILVSANSASCREEA